MRGVLSVLVLFLAFCTTAPAQDLSGSDIMRRAHELVNQSSIKAKVRMNIRTESGQLPAIEFESYSKDRGGKNLIRFSSPGWLKGQATLILDNGDKIMAIFPGSSELRMLPGQVKMQRVQGSNFTYEDLGAGDLFLNDFQTERLTDEKMSGEDCYKVELKRVEGSDAGYSRLIMWISKEHHIPLVIDYFDRSNPDSKIKRLVRKDIREIAGVPTAMQLVMHGEGDKSTTTLRILKVEYNLQLDDAMFTGTGLTSGNLLG